MSHYRVAVVQEPGSPSVDELMAPYSEHLAVEPYILNTVAEVQEIIFEFAADCEKMLAEGEELGAFCKEFCEKRESLSEDKFFDWFIPAWFGEDSPRDDDGNVLSTYNPRSKWDYYSEIDRMTFDEWLTYNVDDGPTPSEALKKEWVTLTTEGDGLFSPQYYLSRYGDYETYARLATMPAAYAVITPDGEWNAPGTVGWFATDDADSDSLRTWCEWMENELIARYKGKVATVTLLECHI